MAGGIKHWPEDERPREKLLKKAPAFLSDAELLALIIGTGDSSSGQSALDMGRQMLADFGNLRNMVHATASEICKIKGVGPAKAARVKAALELANRYGTRRLETLERFTSPIQVFDYFHSEFRNQRKEYFLALLLDGKNRILKRVQISEGSLNQSIVHPREVFSQAVRESAAAVILVHNHPTGDPTPSREDKEITRRLKEAGELLGIKILDHIIIGDGAFLSFADRGFLK